MVTWFSFMYVMLLVWKGILRNLETCFWCIFLAYLFTYRCLFLATSYCYIFIASFHFSFILCTECVHQTSWCETKSYNLCHFMRSSCLFRCSLKYLVQLLYFHITTQYSNVELRTSCPQSEMLAYMVMHMVQLFPFNNLSW